MRADHVGRTAGRTRQGVEVEGGGVAGQDRPRLHGLVEGLEHGLLHRHVLEDRFHHDVGRSHVRVAQGGMDEAHPLLDLGGGELPLLCAGLVALADGADALVEPLAIRFQNRHRDPRVREIHGDATAHGAGADDGRAADRSRRRFLGDVGDLGGGALGEEGVAQRARLGRAQEGEEEVALRAQPLLERL
jgi:hypothetical protein